MAEETPPVEVRLLTAEEAAAHRDELAAVLVDCVEGGASINFMWPFTFDDARTWWDRLMPAVAAGKVVLFAAFAGGRLVGSIQLGVDLPPNQPHRADVKKVIVHRSARGAGIGAALMRAAEAEARRRGLTLLVLDTVSGSDAERLYEKAGWTLAGIIPNYAYMPDGQSIVPTAVYWKAL